MAQSLFCIGLALWLLCGLLLGKWPLILSNAVTLALSRATIALTLRNRRRDHRM